MRILAVAWVGGILLWAMGHGGTRCVVVVIKKTANDKNIGCGDGKGHVALANGTWRSWVWKDYKQKISWEY